LLLNQVLTVKAHEPGSHWKKGWENFTASAVQKISAKKENLVFLLWGKNAQEIENFISQPEKHLILKSSHPSPFSVYRGFSGNRHFSKTNKYLKENSMEEINW
jgi:uracil-DNA glycosylase